jgi:chemotaxis protein CheD
MVKHLLGGNLAHYFDQRLKREVVKLKPGEFFATTRPFVIATVLGSCVAACIRDPARGSAGMNHFMLPSDGREETAPQAGSSLRYGVFAMESLINEFMRHGSARADLEAKVFGGAAVVDSITSDIGLQNAAFVREYLRFEGISVAAEDLGGLAPRKVVFFVESGLVRVKYLWRLDTDTIERREREYARSLRDTSAAETTQAGVELF